MDDHSGLPSGPSTAAAAAQDASGSHTHARVEPNQAPGPSSSLVSPTGTELAHSSVWAEFRQIPLRDMLEVEAIARKWKDRLAQHCCIKALSNATLSECMPRNGTA